MLKNMLANIEFAVLLVSVTYALLIFRLVGLFFPRTGQAVSSMFVRFLLVRTKARAVTVDKTPSHTTRATHVYFAEPPIWLQGFWETN